MHLVWERYRRPMIWARRAAWPLKAVRVVARCGGRSSRIGPEGMDVPHLLVSRSGYARLAHRRMAP